MAVDKAVYGLDPQQGFDSQAGYDQADKAAVQTFPLFWVFLGEAPAVHSTTPIAQSCGSSTVSAF